MSDKELIERYGKPYIDQEFLDKVEKAKKNELLHDDTWKIWERDLTPEQQRYLCELSRELENFSQEEFAVAVIIALQNFPEMVFQLVMEEYLLAINKKENKNGSN